MCPQLLGITVVAKCVPVSSVLRSLYVGNDTDSSFAKINDCCVVSKRSHLPMNFLWLLLLVLLLLMLIINNIATTNNNYNNYITNFILAITSHVEYMK